MSYCRAKEIKHSGPNIGKKIVKKSSASVVNHSVRSTPSASVITARPRGRPPKNGYTEKPTTATTDIGDSAKRKSDGPTSDSSSTKLTTDKFPLR